MIRVLDLFSGMKGWSAPFRDRGHEVYCVEINPIFTADWRDITTLQVHDLPWTPDIVLASPPCTAFTVMQIGRNWTHDHKPKNDRARKGLALLQTTLNLIHALDPQFWIIENPRAKMRRMPQLAMYERRTVTYCQYGEGRMKPTDLWGVFPKSLELRPPCKNGDNCHMRTPRGSRNGTQGMDPAIAAMIPYPLAYDVCRATERDLTNE